MSDKRFNNKNLKDAIDKSGMTREQIAESVGCDTSSITKYYNGDRYPKTDIIIKLAELFNCSTDYLLGVTEAFTPDNKLKFVCDYTGLSEESIIKLHYYNKGELKGLLNGYNRNNEDSKFLLKLFSEMISSDKFVYQIFKYYFSLCVYNQQCLTAIANYNKLLKQDINGTTEKIINISNNSDEALELFNFFTNSINCEFDFEISDFETIVNTYFKQNDQALNNGTMKNLKINVNEEYEKVELREFKIEQLFNTLLVDIGKDIFSDNDTIVKNTIDEYDRQISKAIKKIAHFKDGETNE